MEIKNRKSDSTHILCALVFGVFIFYTQYFQYVFFEIPKLVTILGAALIGICMYYFIAYEIDLYEFSIKELQIFFVFYAVTFFTGFIGSFRNFGVSAHINSWIGCFLYFLIVPSIMYIVVTKGDILAFSKWYCIFALICALTLIVNPIRSNESLSVNDIRYTIGKALNVNMLGQYFTFGCWCTLLLVTLKPKFRLLGVASVGILLYAVEMTASRKNLIAILLIAGLWFLMVWFPENKKNGIKIIIISVLLAIVSYVVYTKFFLGSTLSLRMGNLFVNESGNRNSRFDMYEKAFELFRLHPFTGWGFKGYSYFFYSNSSAYSHATYAEVLACTGIIGCCLFFGMYIYSIRKVVKMIRFTNKKHELIDENRILKMILILWFSILFMGLGVIYIYELICYIIFGILFSTIRYVEWNIKEKTK